MVNMLRWSSFAIYVELFPASMRSDDPDFEPSSVFADALWSEGADRGISISGTRSRIRLSLEIDDEAAGAPPWFLIEVLDVMIKNEIEGDVTTQREVTVMADPESRRRTGVVG